jgi:hypothetical protein
MTGDGRSSDRLRERTCRAASDRSVFLTPLQGGDEHRAVIRHDVHLAALEAARQVMRAYYSERRRQL